MKQYLNVLQKILDEGVEKESGRANMPNTFGISKADISMNMSDGFPLLTTKKMYWKGIVHELLWFLRGDTNIKYLVDNNVHIWDQDAYRWYLKFVNTLEYPDYDCMMDDPENGCTRPFTIEEFVSAIETLSPVTLYVDKGYKLGDLGKVYGYQWRRKEKILPDGSIEIIDQVASVIESLKTNPYSRYHIIDAWDKTDFRDMALPPCHLLYQFVVRPLTEEEKIAYLGHWVTYDDNVPKFYLDLNMYQRSCDTFLGVPFNLASMSLLLHIIAKTCNMVPGIANWVGGDTHIYLDHITMVETQLDRNTRTLPKLWIDLDLNSLDDILNLTVSDFRIENYLPHPAIKAELFTGIKK